MNEDLTPMGRDRQAQWEAIQNIGKHKAQPVLDIREEIEKQLLELLGKGFEQPAYDMADAILALIQPLIEKAKQGRREVVEWVNHHGCIEPRDPVWQAFLKEKGIEL